MISGGKLVFAFFHPRYYARGNKLKKYDLLKELTCGIIVPEPYQGPEIAKVIPGVCIFTNMIRPSAEKQTPVNSFEFNALRANL